jgi:hypothetical protein
VLGQDTNGRVTAFLAKGLIHSPKCIAVDYPDDAGMPTAAAPPNLFGHDLEGCCQKQQTG